jgi:internalin A
VSRSNSALLSRAIKVAEETGRLDLSHRGLTRLPLRLLKQVDGLQELWLDNNQLTQLPPEIGHLTSLRVLRLENNRLTRLPPEVGQLTSLRQLRLDGNRLTVLPPEIGQLKGLAELRLDGNQLTALPVEVGQLTKLWMLWLDGNELTALPSEIGQLISLQELWLYHNTLTELPAKFGQLSSLRQLRLDDNLLTELPAEFWRLKDLEKLLLDGNRLTGLPPEFGRLTRLRQLRLDGNRLAALPPEIGQLKSLEELRLDGNELTGLPPDIGRLTRLRQLRVDGNRLTALPRELGQLKSLKELRLDGNELTGFPPDIGRLTSLRQLRLDGNRLTALPRQLADLLSRGLELGLAGNPLQEPILELHEQRGSALIAYLRSLEDAIPHYEAKVLLVGEGNVGKTSLIAALRNEPFVEGRPITHGISTLPLALQHPKLDVDMTARAWDFGGQEVYRITHQFFFTRRAVYLIVWKPREGQEQNEVEGWLRRVRLRVTSEARALVVATHCSGDRYPDLDYPHLKQAFPKLLAGQFQIDSKTGRGIPELRQTVAAEVAGLPEMGQLLSPRWIAARDEVLSLAESEPQIPFAQFAGICERHGVRGEETTTLAELPHILGRVIYYGDDEGLRDVVVLNPEWLTSAISYVIGGEATRKADGVLDHARLREIWQRSPEGPAYSARYHPYFLRLMEKFDVSYRLEDDRYRSLVAQLVPYDRPSLPWDFHIPPPKGIRRLALICQLSEPVPGLMA